jgi:hypothetical protein
MVYAFLRSIKAFIENDYVLFAIYVTYLGPLPPAIEYFYILYKNLTIVFLNYITRYLLNVNFLQPFLQFQRVILNAVGAIVAFYSNEKV